MRLLHLLSSQALNLISKSVVFLNVLPKKKFCFIYSGTLGYKHNAELFIKIAEQFPQVIILISSSGKFASKLKEVALDRGLICYPMAGTIDGRCGDHVLLAPPFIVSTEELRKMVTILGDAVDVVLQNLSLAN